VGGEGRGPRKKEKSSGKRKNAQLRDIAVLKLMPGSQMKSTSNFGGKKKSNSFKKKTADELRKKGRGEKSIAKTRGHGTSLPCPRDHERLSPWPILNGTEHHPEGKKARSKSVRKGKKFTWKGSYSSSREDRVKSRLSKLRGEKGEGRALKKKDRSGEKRRSSTTRLEEE